MKPLNFDIHESKEKDSSTQSFQQSYQTISYEVIKATSIETLTNPRKCTLRRASKVTISNFRIPQIVDQHSPMLFASLFVGTVTRKKRNRLP